MAVYDSSNIKDTRVLLSQTPPNYVPNNYYLKELQDKVDADWRFRPNRFDIEKEDQRGTEVYNPIQVVLQSIKTDKGEDVSQDWMRVVYKNIQHEVHIGERFRIPYNFNINTPNSEKNIWIATNINRIQQTASQVICRCNGTIIGMYTDENGVNHYHEEPVIQTTKLTSPNFQYSEIAIDPKGQLTIIAQHNKYTRQWYINQRFIIGYDRVYKVSNIIKTDSETTYDAYNVGIIRVYLDQDQSSELDNFKDRIAYNGDINTPVEDVESAKKDKASYTLSIVDNNNDIINIPQSLPANFVFKPAVFKDGVITDIVVATDFQLSGKHASKAVINDFVEIIDNDHMYTINKLASDPGLYLNITCNTTTPSGELSLQFKTKLNA